MSLNKAIEHGKEHRKPYVGAKAIDCTCRNHGSCSWCRDNRLHQQLKIDEASRQALEEYETDALIRAAKNANINKEDLTAIFWEKGLMGVYNLGLKNMLDYINEAGEYYENDR